MKSLAIPCITILLLTGCSTFGSHPHADQTGSYDANSDFKFGAPRAGSAAKSDPARTVRRFSILTNDEETELFQALERARELHAQLRVYEAMTAISIDRQKELAARAKATNTKRKLSKSPSATVAIKSTRPIAQDASKVAGVGAPNVAKGQQENARPVNLSAKAAMNDKIIVPATWHQVNKHLSKPSL